MSLLDDFPFSSKSYIVKQTTYKKIGQQNSTAFCLTRKLSRSYVYSCRGPWLKAEAISTVELYFASFCIMVCLPGCDGGGVDLEEDWQGGFDGTASYDDVLALHDALHDAQGIVDRSLHLVAVEVVGAAEDDGGCGAGLGLLDEQEFVVADAGLTNFQSVTCITTISMTVLQKWLCNCRVKIKPTFCSKWDLIFSNFDSLYCLKWAVWPDWEKFKQNLRVQLVLWKIMNCFG